MFYNVLDFDIVGDGVTNNTEVINLLSEKMKKTGGTMYFPAGKYVTGTIFLHSNMNLVLDAGAILLGSENFNDYPCIEGIEGYTRAGHWGLISAYDCQDICIKGSGTIDARGQYWWNSGKTDLERPRTISFISCKMVKIENITIRNSPCWTVHPMCCENVSIRGISIYNPYDSPNTDGINPESCKNVRISDCHIDVGDDCITIKSGTEDDLFQKQYACENIIVNNCTMAHGHGGVVFGSEMSGGVKNVIVNNCVFQNTDRGIRIKTRRYRGGYIQGLNISNIIMDNVMACITMNEYYSCGVYDQSKKDIFDPCHREINELTPVIADINITGIIGQNIQGVGIYMYGLPELPIQNVVISDVHLNVTGVEKGVYAVAAPERELSYGDGIFMENTRNIKMNNVNINCIMEKTIIKNCRNINLNGKQIA